MLKWLVQQRTSEVGPGSGSSAASSSGGLITDDPLATLQFPGDEKRRRRNGGAGGGGRNKEIYSVNRCAVRAIHSMCVRTANAR